MTLVETVMKRKRLFMSKEKKVPGTVFLTKRDLIHFNDFMRRQSYNTNWENLKFGDILLGMTIIETNSLSKSKTISF